jgi:hypothetical protein
MAISEELQRRIGNLTGANIMDMVGDTKGAISNKEMEMFMKSTPGQMSDQDMNIMMANQAARQGISGPEQRAAMIKKTAMDMGKMISDEDANAFGVGSMSFEDAMSKAFVMDMVGRTKGAISNKEMQMFVEAFTGEDQETLDRLLKQEAALESAPLGPLAQELRAQGMKEDTELAHVRLGEVILPPEFLDDDEFGTAVERKFEEAGINPEEAVVGGIGTLNPSTGLQQFFLKKLAKGLKKVVKKVAPYAGLIAAPFTGGASAALIGGIGGAIGGGGIKGALKGAALGGAGSALFGGAAGAGSGGISSFFNPAKGSTGIFGGQLGPNIRSGIGGLFKTPDFNPASGDISGGGIFGRAKEFILPGQDQRGLFSNLFGAGAPQQSVDDIANNVPGAKTRVERLRAEGLSDAQIMADLQRSGYAPTSRPGVLSGLFSGGQQQQLYDAQGNPVQQRSGVLSNILGGGGGGGGLGDFAKVAGIGALATGLGKLAYEDAKKQKGVSLTPLTTMSPTGRYNIEAEIARRMGQQRPNPVEFGLLPEGTLPVLSGGQPRQAAYGGAIEDLQGGMARGLRYGGGIMAFAQGGAVAMQEGGEMDPGSFPRMDGNINGPGTEQSDDIPAMLSDGEFVMTARAVRGAGSYEMQTEPGGIINLVPSLEEDRERGMDVMYKVMDTFSGQANPS